MNEDSVALIMCEKCVYRIRILKKKKDLELSADILLKDNANIGTKQAILLAVPGETF